MLDIKTMKSTTDPVRLRAQFGDIRSLKVFLQGIFTALLLSSAHSAVTLTTLYSFSGPDGANPVGGLLQGRDGNFYGITSENSLTGTNYGTVFSITPQGQFTNLYWFTGGDDGSEPQVGLTDGGDGNFYGSTAYRGANSWGTIFKITPSGTFNIVAQLDSFSGSVATRLVLGADANFYTLGNFGFGSGFGSALRIAPGGTGLALATFNGTNGFTGWGFSRDVFIQGLDGNFYGATQFGGPEFAGEFVNPAYGTVFEMEPDGTLNTLMNFNGTNGAYVTALLQGHDGNLYGTAYSGGPAFIDSPFGGNGGFGTLFKLSTNGDFTPLAVFNGTNGGGPSSLILGGDGTFYGTTENGGTFGKGTVFRMTAGGTVSSLFSFNGTNGAQPVSSPLIQTADGSFYGMTYSGGASNRGTIFKLSFSESSPVIQSIARTGSTLNFTWSALPGRTYQVQFATEWTQSNWTNSGPPMTATNDTATASDVIGPDQRRFYRVAQLAN
jgi:uncharacterized repeat protein (TIGR03803 family)